MEDQDIKLQPNTILKKCEDTHNIYTYFVLDNKPKDLTTLGIPRMDVECANCDLQGQFWWQNRQELRLEFYCPKCELTWTIECKRKEK